MGRHWVRISTSDQFWYSLVCCLSAFVLVFTLVFVIEMRDKRTVRTLM
ncbi:hypothetical protein Hdeb2414_s0035g00729561 [Helianthus debilis subsp. tardiflorus]